VREQGNTELRTGRGKQMNAKSKKQVGERWEHINRTNKQTPWSESASKLYRPRDRRL
jgi:hypothetical protein